MSANIDSPSQAGEFTGRHMALVITAFFGVVIAANVVLAVLASQTWTGLIVANGYVASQQHNGMLAEARAQAARGWTMSIERRPEGVQLRIADGQGVSVDGLEVHAAIGRPTHEHEDREAVLEQWPGGLYGARLDLAAGEWTVAIRAFDDTGLVFRRDIRLRVANGTAPAQ